MEADNISHILVPSHVGLYLNEIILIFYYKYLFNIESVAKIHKKNSARM